MTVEQSAQRGGARHRHGPRFWLRYAEHDLPLPTGEFVLGRDASCTFVLDSSLVSRRHARFRVTETAAIIEDLGSANGVFVNGARIEGPVPLSDGDCIGIADEQVQLVCRDPAERRESVTLTGVERTDTVDAGGATLPAESAEDDTPLIRIGGVEQPSDAVESEKTGIADPLTLMGVLIEKMIASRRVDEAERIATGPLTKLLDQTKAGRPVLPEVIASAATHALKLATATRRARWFDYVMQLYLGAGCVLPAGVVDEMHLVLRAFPRGTPVDQDLLRRYADRMSLESGRLGPAERFALQRFDVIVRMARTL